MSYLPWSLQFQPSNRQHFYTPALLVSRERGYLLAPPQGQGKPDFRVSPPAAEPLPCGWTEHGRVRWVRRGPALLSRLPLGIVERGRDAGRSGRFGFCAESATCLVNVGEFLSLSEPELLQLESGNRDGPHLTEGF